MIRLRAFAFTSSLLAGLSAAVAQPANDACVTPESISGYGQYGWDSSGASTDGVSVPSCTFFGNDQVYNDIWYCWTASENAIVQATTCSLTSLDTKLNVYEGCTCPEGAALLACVDDSCGVQSRVQWLAEAGESYLIRLGSYDPNDTGTGLLEITSIPLPILNGPVVHPVTGHEYYLLNPSSANAARNIALFMGGDLVTIGDADENEFVRSQVLRFDGADRRGWLGLNDLAEEGAFVWFSGEPVLFTNWSGGEPNNSGGVEDHVEMFGNGAWNDNRETPVATVYGIVEVPPAPPACPGDVDGDDDVDLTDLATMLANFGTGSGATHGMGDLDGDGDVDLTDLATLLANFGTTC